MGVGGVSFAVAEQKGHCSWIAEAGNDAQSVFRFGFRPGAAVALIELAPPPISDAAKHQIIASYATLPLSFEANYGQADPQVKFLARGRGYSLFLTSADAVLAVRHRAERRPERSPGILRAQLLLRLP